MARAAWLCLCATALLACRRDSAPLGSSDKPRGATRPSVAAAPVEAPEEETEPEPEQPPLPDWAKDPQASRDATVKDAKALADAGADTGPKRDLSEELKSAVGNPALCIKPRLASENVARDITITLSAMAMETGTLGRTSVAAPGLQADEIACIKAMLDHARVGPNVPEAPRDVTAEVRLVRAAPTAPQAPAVE